MAALGPIRRSSDTRCKTKYNSGDNLLCLFKRPPKAPLDARQALTAAMVKKPSCRGKRVEFCAPRYQTMTKTAKHCTIAGVPTRHNTRGQHVIVSETTRNVHRRWWCGRGTKGSISVENAHMGSAFYTSEKIRESLSDFENPQQQVAARRIQFAKNIAWCSSRAACSDTRVLNSN